MNTSDNKDINRIVTDATYTSMKVQIWFEFRVSELQNKLRVSQLNRNSTLTVKLTLTLTITVKL